MRIAAVICCVAILAGCFGRTDRLPSYRSTLAVEADLRDVDRPQPTDTPPPAMTLGPGDVLDIQVAGIAGTRERCPIGVDGMLYYGPTDGVRAAGHTLDEIADDLGVALRAWYREPRPAVVPAVLLSRAATVLGRVGRPGAQPLIGGERVVDLIAGAGGLAGGQSSENSEEIADLSGALYVRGATTLAIDFVALMQGAKPEHNVLVHPGDYMYIPSGQSREINVLGAVSGPRPVPYQQGVTVARAVAEAGGYTRDAYIDRIVIVRGSTSRPRAGLVNLRAILEGRRPDVALQPRDIVYVPGRTSENPRFLLDIANRAVVTSIASSYANEVYDDLFDAGDREDANDILDIVLP